MIEELEFAKNLKGGEYIITEFMYTNEGGQLKPAFCKAKVKQFYPDMICENEVENKEEPAISQPLIECEKLMTIDGVEVDDMFIGVRGCKIRFMTEEEIVEFEKHYNKEL